jgi:hypothetical protein
MAYAEVAVTDGPPSDDAEWAAPGAGTFTATLHVLSQRQAVVDDSDGRDQSPSRCLSGATLAWLISPQGVLRELDRSQNLDHMLP